MATARTSKHFMMSLLEAWLKCFAIRHHKYGDHGRFCIWDGEAALLLYDILLSLHLDWVKQGVKTVKQAKQKIEADVGVDANDVYVLLGPRVMEDSEKLPLARNLDIFFREDSR